MATERERSIEKFNSLFALWNAQNLEKQLQKQKDAEVKKAQKL
jgi:hypothetical protein